MKNIAVIDYGFGNIKSVLNALNFCAKSLPLKADVISLPNELLQYDAAILPGVGAFGPAVNFLKTQGFNEALRSYVKSGKMLYGICLGFQLFFTTGYENGVYEGLNIVEGEVKKFEFDVHTLKIPHIGWNSVNQTHTDGAKQMFNGVEDKENFYFVHSYYAMPKDKTKASSFCNYGIDFCSSVAFENVWGSQFHPEKSGEKGLKILMNFIEAAK
ncbi:MAG: imidazole glycerol phosphate synthase subunit HisH [Endomicrobium sp.]|jgi:glutamine amidotransferase|nr:imidazole glycerol phosphate synthase subunit HisH [Endomicrobium sp.]